MIPIISFEVFSYSNNKTLHLNLSICNNIPIEYKFPVNIDQYNLDIYDPSSRYYDDNCSYMSNISLYDRKKEYNLNHNLSICYKDCKFSNYNINSQIVTCFCNIKSSYINKSEELFINLN